MSSEQVLFATSSRGESISPARWNLRCSALALATIMATPAFAQTAAPSTPTVSSPEATAQGEVTPATSTQDTSENGSGGLQDIVVTARRTSERLQDIPASVSAITGDQVAKLTSLSDIQSLVAGVTFKTFGPIPTVGIRGFGNRTQAGNATNSTVGIFQDGVFVAPPLVAMASRVDTSRVEIAKGPQSTLYGRSSFTGAINIVTNDPEKTLAGYVDAGYGHSATNGDDLWRIQGAISLPISETLAVRFYGLREKRDGFTLDSVTGNRGGGYDRTIGRVRILWEPSDAVTARLSGTIIRDNLPIAIVHSGRQFPPLGQNNLFGNPLSAAVRSALQFGTNVWDAIYVNPQSSKTRGEQVTLDLRFQTPMGELASLTDYQHSNQDVRTALDLTRLAYARGDTLFDEKRYSQELRLSNKTGRFNYLLGVYYLHIDASQGGGKTPDLDHPFAAFGPGSAFFDGLVVRPVPTQPGISINALIQPAYTQTNAFAAFGRLGYDFTDRLNLTVGIRQSRDELRGPTATYLRATATGALIPTAAPFYRRGDFDATTGDANLSYKIAPDVTAYASYARGNSPGGLNLGGAARVNFAPQKVDAYEVGLKSQLLNRRLQLNVALFDNEYKDLQITQNVFLSGALTPLVTNPADARGRGVDLDAVAVASDHIRFGVQYTYADSKITRFALAPAPAPQIDFLGAPLVRSPKHSLNGSVTLSGDVGPGKVVFTAEESYTSSYTNDYQGAAVGTSYPGISGVLPAGVTTTQVLALFRTPGYAITNLNASYTVGNWQLSGLVRNLFNKQYIAGVLAFDAVTYPQELAGEPRTAEISLRYKF